MSAKTRANLKLRFALFKIWFLKNIFVFIQVALIVIFVLMLTGNINAHTPILGKIVYPLFSSLIDEIDNIANEREITGLMDFFSIFISVTISIGMFVMKTKTIVVDDIKDDSLKRAIISANLYFNSNGNLVKRIEKITQTDINGDGLISDEEMTKSINKRGVFSGLFTSIKELFVIFTADFTGEDKKDKEIMEKTLEESELKQASNELDELINDLDNDTDKEAISNVADAGLTVINNAIDADDELHEEEKTKRKGIFASIKNFFFKKKEKEVSDNEDVLSNDKDIVELIENNIDKITDNEEVKEVVVTAAPKVQEVVQKTVAKKNYNPDSADAFIDMLNGN